MMIDVIDVNEAAEILDVSPSMFRVYMRAGKFKTARKMRGTRWVVSRKEIEGVADGSIKCDLGGAWAGTYGKDD